MDSSIWLYTVNMGGFIVHEKGYPKIFYIYANSVDLASYLGLHCLEK